MMKKPLIAVIILSCVLILAGCKNSKPSQRNLKKLKKEYATIIVKKQQFKKVLYFTGTLMPITRVPVITPAEGIIEKQLFQYGQKVTKGQLLFVIKSFKQQTEYQESLITYLKAKQAADRSQTAFVNAVTLEKEGLKSVDGVIQAKNSYMLSKLSLLQSEAKLRRTISNHNLKAIKKLTLDNIDAVVKKLDLGKVAKEVEITSPLDSVALISSNGKIKLGAAVKQNQTLLYLGTKDRLQAHIAINEINVNQLHVGQHAVITGVAFSPSILNGYIVDIAAQASPQASSPTYSALIEITKIPPELLAVIRIGMSVKIAIDVTRKPQILIPISAVNPDTQTVKLFDPITGTVTNQLVGTGETTFKDVIITSGLKPGDHILVPH